MRLSRVLTILVIAFAAVAGNTVAPSPAATTIGDGVTDDSSFWPADPGEIAVIANDRRIAITDGNATIDFSKDLEIPRRDLESYINVAVGDGLVVSLVTTFERANEIIAVELATGKVSRATCDACSGVAIADGHIVSVASEQQKFSLRIFDHELSAQSVVPIEVLEPQSESTVPLGPFVSAAVEGTADDEVVISSIWSHDGRRGPTIVALYTLDGTLGRRWTLDDVIYDATTSPDGRYLALAVGGSGGACSSVAAPLLIDAQQPESIRLVQEAWTRRRNNAEYLFTSDVWWNGTEIVALVTRLDTQSPRCIFGRDIHRFDLNGETSAPIQTHRLTQYRLLGTGCGRALLTEQHGPYRSGNYAERLYLIEGSEHHRIKGYDSILWTAPRAETCTTLPGLTGS